MMKLETVIYGMVKFKNENCAFIQYPSRPKFYAPENLMMSQFFFLFRRFLVISEVVETHLEFLMRGIVGQGSMVGSLIHGGWSFRRRRSTNTDRGSSQELEVVVHIGFDLAHFLIESRVTVA